MKTQAAITLIVLALFAGLLLTDLGAQTKCGAEREAVKTMRDADTPKIVNGKQSTIEELTSFPAPTRKALDEHSASRFPQEQIIYTVTGTLVGAKLERDGDYHVVIASLKQPALTMIVEIPSPDCVEGGTKSIVDRLRKQLAQRFPNGKITPKFRAPEYGETITVTGPGFFDIKHGTPQTGVAPNGFELHPLQKIEFVRAGFVDCRIESNKDRCAEIFGK